MWSLWSFGWNLLSKSVVPLGTQLHSCWGEALPPYAPSSRLLFPGQWRNGSSKTKHPSLNCLTETTGTGGKLRLSELIRVSVLMWHLLYKQHYKAAQSINSLAWAVLVTTLHHITALSDVKCPILRSSFFLIFFNSYHISYAFICIVLLSLLIGYIKDFYHVISSPRLGRCSNDAIFDVILGQMLNWAEFTEKSFDLYVSSRCHQKRHRFFVCFVLKS